MDTPFVQTHCLTVRQSDRQIYLIMPPDFSRKQLEMIKAVPAQIDTAFKFILILNVIINTVTAKESQPIFNEKLGYRERAT